MDFTRLRLSGFKSFVDKTELSIEPGLTGIVGPNGCGKSNITDALRWVMGESRPKNMRGSGMEDVIFSGTATRSPRNFAEVSLLLDNQKKDAPAPFTNAEQIEIVRRIERDSGSAYRINGDDQRARDVQMLFADAATGAHSPSLVGQGRVAALINAKPSERRQLLEEAAGISGLHSRRHEAELRLRATEKNLERVADILGQMDTQLASLKKQARQAARYRTINDRVRKAEGLLYHLRWLEAEALRDKAAAELRAAETRVNERAGTTAQASTAQAEAAAALPPLRQAEAEAAAARHRLTVARDQLDAEEQRVRQALAELQARADQLEQDFSREESQKTDAEKTLDQLRAEQQDLQTVLESGQSQRDRLAELADEAARIAQEAETAFDAVNAALAERLALGRSLNERLAESRSAKQRAEEERASLADQLAALDREAADSGEHVAEQEISVARDAITQADAAHQQAEDSLQKTSAQARETAEALGQAEQTLRRIDAQINALEDLLRAEQSADFPAALDKVKAAPGFEAALGAALGDVLEASLDETAPLSVRNLGPFAKPLDFPFGVQRLSEVVIAPRALARALQQVGIVLNAAHGDALQRQLAPGQMLVSKQGGFWRWDGYRVAEGSATPAAQRLEQRNRLTALQPERSAALETRAAAQDADAQVRQALDEAETEERQTRLAARAAQDALINLREKLAESERRKAELEGRRQRIIDGQKRTDETISQMDDRIREAEAKLGTLENEQQLRARVDSARRTMEDKRAALAEARSAEAAFQREQQLRRERIDAISREIAGWQQRRDAAQSQMDALVQRRSELQESAAKQAERPAEIAEERRGLESQLADAGEVYAAAERARAEAESNLSASDKALRDAERGLSEARESRIRAEGHNEQAAERIADLLKRIEEVLEAAPAALPEIAELKEGEDLPDLDTANQRVERLRRERDNMGPVNLRAELEAEELEAERAKLEGERADLETAINKLRQGISTLNREGRERLLAAFTQVNEHFSDLFTRLFGGGKAHLSLVEAEDPLEAGLEILARPPGKRLQIMSLLSGGEQALTAMALIFAVFLTNPAPICVLDEVDAPLDDTNVERFCDLVRDICNKTGTRFIVVTHHAVTMSRLDRLYGVTMGERGVSQLVSVDLHRAEELAAAE